MPKSSQSSAGGASSGHPQLQPLPPPPLTSRQERLIESAGDADMRVATSEFKWQVQTGQGRKKKWSDAWESLDQTLEAAYKAGEHECLWTW